MGKYEIEPVANFHCNTGEGPYWDADRQMVYWTDIPNGRLFRYDLKSNESEQFYRGRQVGGFTLQEDGRLLLFREDEFAVLNDDGTTQTLKEGIDEGMERFNDVCADPAGRVFAGTIGKTRESGGLYRVDHDGKVTRLFTGTGCANGMDWTPDLKQMYWTDTSANTIFIFDYDRTTGEMSNRRVFVTASKDEGFCDGMTVDTEGCIWSAHWDGHGIFRYSPEGEFMEKIEFPVAKVSSVIFGGPDLSDLYVTTAGGEDGSTTADGTLYRVSVEVQGHPEPRSRISVS